MHSKGVTNRHITGFERVYKGSFNFRAIQASDLHGEIHRAARPEVSCSLTVGKQAVAGLPFRNFWGLRVYTPNLKPTWSLSYQHGACLPEGSLRLKFCTWGPKCLATFSYQQGCEVLQLLCLSCLHDRAT